MMPNGLIGNQAAYASNNRADKGSFAVSGCPSDNRASNRTTADNCGRASSAAIVIVVAVAVIATIAILAVVSVVIVTIAVVITAISTVAIISVVFSTRRGGLVVAASSVRLVRALSRQHRCG